MADQANILMMGLPDSGKTTYLAALYHILRAEDEIDTSLTLRTEPADREYFHDIEGVWMRFEPMARSRHTEPKETRLELRGSTGDEIDLRIPDVSGETFNDLWERGSWLASVRDFAMEATGLLLFLRTDDVDRPMLIEVLDPARALQPEVEKPAPREWSAEHAPTQTKLADLLESLWEMRPRLPVAVIASAWDAVAEEGVPPNRWLEFNLPLLWQMLTSNEEAHPWRAFGVSAQGGDLGDQAVRDALAKRRPPGSRVIVRDSDETHDLTVPLTWLLAQKH